MYVVRQWQWFKTKYSYIIVRLVSCSPPDPRHASAVAAADDGVTLSANYTFASVHTSRTTGAVESAHTYNTELIISLAGHRMRSERATCERRTAEPVHSIVSGTGRSAGADASSPVQYMCVYRRCRRVLAGRALSINNNARVHIELDKRTNTHTLHPLLALVWMCECDMALIIYS